MVTTLKVIGMVAVVVLVILVIVCFIWLRPKPAEPETEPAEQAKEVPPRPETLKEAVEILNTPKLLVAFLNEYFTTEERQGIVAYEPEEFYNRQKGAAHDFAVFSAYVLRQNSFEAGVIRFNYRVNTEEGTYAVAVFRDTDKPKYLIITDVGVDIFTHGWSFEDLIKAEEQRLNVKAYEYTYFPAGLGITDINEPAPGRDWIAVE